MGPDQQYRQSNTIGALRLFFASLVIVSHSAEMLDGDRHRELLYSTFHTLTFGGLAVDAFFLISGYLIAASFVGSSSTLSYFRKRVLRIFPAFLICSLLCTFVVAPLGGADLAGLTAKAWFRIFYRLVTLKPPEVDGAFSGLPIPALNGSTWTIATEFRCYIMACILGLLGLYRRRMLFLFLTAAVLLSNLVFFLPGAQRFADAPGWVVFLIGSPDKSLMLHSAFLVGTCFWLYRDQIPYRAPWAIGCAIALLALLFARPVAEISLLALGGYALFYVAFKIRWKPLLVINAKDDVSYGVYLYAWPISILLIWYWRDIPVGLLGVLTFIGATALGTVSWFLVEKPAMRFGRDRREALTLPGADVAPSKRPPTIPTDGKPDSATVR